ncbi:LysM peptidoglycan-binding domain-containing protein [Chromobacterium sp. IIBBL 290-4]|uniref:LysM peptidoglycan-binding domain-containing protein n=1 Tax=Chromobacterium sp. IIBBL 290-4 TaxID=2953890 RepID=UPI0020B71126|nr:LysM peptidoglycan-binding domain-containing protein [Chromobacterium sp. IIBBL 290-4]UTH74853.1 LysM peptidoglycan-binding domain-containing protein [Chromobacterium sp. IIBBL 290-4]
MSLALLSASTAIAAANPAPAQSVDEGLAAGLDMMLQNSSLLRNGDDVWKRVREGFQMDEVSADTVRRQERFYASRPEYFKRTLDRSRKYLFHIMNEVERRGMPTEIALLPMVESAFVPTNSSRVGAAGLWQFMPATGRQYGLEQTWWYDGRRDVVDATRAALDYLQNLYAQFGDWGLALAAYNWGEGNVARAIAKAQAAGVTPSYETIRMPNETRNYVPKLLAVRNILLDPEKYGVHLDKFPNKPYFVSVSTGKHMNIDIAAKLAGMSVSDFKELNPAFNLPVFAYKAGRQMLLPVAKAEKFQASLEKWDKPLLTWEVYVPKSDQNVRDIANDHGMSASSLLAANRISGATLRAGQPVLVAMNKQLNDGQPLESVDTPLSQPAIAGATMLAQADETPAPAPQPSPSAAPAVLTASAAPVPAATPAVQPVAVIAAAAPEAVPATASNAIEPNIARQTTTLLASAAPDDNGPARSLATRDLGSYTVASGDTLYSIARRSNLSVDELKALNGLDGNLVQAGQQLRLKADAQQDALLASNESKRDPALIQAADNRPAPSNRHSAEYVVQRGDTVFSIARRFGVTHHDIQKLNGSRQPSHLQPGQKVKIVGL